MQEPFPASDDFIGYSISFSPAPPPPVTTPILVPSGSNMHVVEGLANFTNYTITVATYNQAGTGPPTHISIQTVEAGELSHGGLTMLCQHFPHPPPHTAPSAPRAVEVNPIGSTSILVSWLAPDPPNGVLTEYLVRVLLASTGEEFSRTSVGVSAESVLQSVSVGGLDLDNIGYRVLVSASTSIGMGPTSAPISVGADVGTTAAPQTTPTPTSAETTDVASTDDLETVTPPSSDTPPSVTTPMNSSVSCDTVCYVVRIVPAVVAGVAVLVVIGTIVLVVLCVRHQQTSCRKNKTGLYQFQDNNFKYVGSCHTCMCTSHMHVHVTHACTRHTCMYTSHMHVHVTHACTRHTCMYTSHMHVHVTHACTRHTCMYTSHMHVHVTHACARHTCMYTSHMHVKGSKLPITIARRFN